MAGLFSLIKTTFGILASLFVYLIANFLYFAPKKYEEFYNKQGVPSPGYKLIVGNSPEMRAAAQADNPFSFYRQLSQKYGKLFQMFMGPYHRLVCISPSLLQEVFVRKAHLYVKTRSISYVFRPLLGNGLVLSEGDIWKSQRSYINPAFHFKNIKEMIGLMCDCTQRTVPKWVPADKVGVPFEMECHFAFSSLTLEVIAATAFGSSFRDLPNASNIVYHAFVECLDTIQARMFASIAFLPILRDLPIAGKPKVDKGVADIQGLVDRILELRRNGTNKPLGGGKDLLQLLLDARDPDGKAMDEGLLKDELKTFVLAGHETTSNLLSWMAYRLCMHPDMQQKCAEEVLQVLPNLAIPDYDKLKRLHYLDAFMDETLRMHPPVATLSREALVDHVISGVKDDGSKWDVEIKAGTVIGTHVPTLHMDPSIWPEPERFDPTRFLARPVAGGGAPVADGEEEEAMQKPRYAPCAFLAFSAGPRSCIGSQFAKLEAKVIMAAILQRFSLEMTAGQKIVPNVALTIRPKYGLTVRFSPRATNAAE